MEESAALKTGVLLVWFGLLFALERLRPVVPWPAADGWFGWRRLARNGGIAVVTMATSMLVVVPVSVWAASLSLGLRPNWWSGPLGLALDLLLLDFWIYWWHRANHQVPLLWRFHEVHHLDHVLDTTSAVRFHFGELLLSTGVRAVVIVGVGIPWTSVLVFELLVLVSALFHHSNLALPGWLERRLSWIVVTPSIHWVHHHAVRRDTDSNYATILSLWDPLFGTRSATRRTPALPIGVEGEPERSLVALIGRPFLGR